MDIISVSNNFDTLGWGYIMCSHPVSYQDLENLVGEIDPDIYELQRMHRANGIILVKNPESFFLLLYKIL